MSFNTEIPLPVRRAVLERDGWTCRDCGTSIHKHRSGVHYGLHHIDMRRKDVHHPDNLALLCRTCHNRRHPHALCDGMPDPCRMTGTEVRKALSQLAGDLRLESARHCQDDPQPSVAVLERRIAAAYLRRPDDVRATIRLWLSEELSSEA